MTSIVGYTGFVGSNLEKQFHFDGLYNSKNIDEAFGTKPDLLIYSGVRAEKFLANKEPEKDLDIVKNALENIKKIAPKQVVLISTIDVYKNPVDVNEDTEIDTVNLQPYGYHRYLLEKWVEDSFDHLILRLPGLYGQNIKKNFIYDYINVIPSMLTEEKFKSLYEKDGFLIAFYNQLGNGFYKCRELTNEERTLLKHYFEKIGFSALNFTDSRGSFQFYNLAFLWGHIQKALKEKIKKLNLSSQPITIEELYFYLRGKNFINEVSQQVVSYNIKTKYDAIFNGKDGYIFDKSFVLNDIKSFVETQV